MRRLAIFAAVVPLLFAAACGGSGGGGAAQSSSAAGEVKVSGEAGKKPQVTFTAGRPPATSSARTLTPGQGAQIKDGDMVVTNITAYKWDGKTNAAAGSTYDEGAPQLIKVSAQLPGVVHKAFQEAKPGSRFLTVVAKDSLTADQQAQAKAQGADLSAASVYVFDVVAVPSAKAAHGTAVDPGVKGVTVENPGGDAAPKLTAKTNEPAPKKLVAKTVIKGSGPATKAGQQLVVQYVGEIWGSGKTFDSSWARGEPAMFKIGAGQVVKGWDQGLVGVPVGSRVLLAIPPDLGYGKQGKDIIKGTDTMVFVVDVLAAY